MNIRYRVTLSSEERSQAEALIASGKAAVRKVKRAQILLAAAAGSKDEAIAANVGVGTSTVSEPSSASWRRGWSARWSMHLARSQSASWPAMRKRC